MIGLKPAEKPRICMWYRLNDHILTLVKVPGDVTDAFLDAYTIGMPDGWALITLPPMLLRTARA